MASENPSQPERYRIGDLRLDVGRRIVSRDGRRIRLPQLSFDLLLALARHAPNVVSTDRFMEEVWSGRVVNAETVAKRVEMVRHALGDDSHEPRYIGLVRSHGYQLLMPVEAIADSPRLSRRRWPAYLATAGLAAVAILLGARAVWRDTATAAAPSVVVLPFENRSARADDAFFVEGIHDDLLTLLAQVGDLKVISRTTSLRLEPELSIRQIGRDLDVGMVVEGAVQRAGDRIWVNIQLIDAATETHLWAQRYDRELTAANVYEIQREIVRAIAGNLRAELSPREQQRLVAVPTGSMAALEAYFLGRQRLAMRSTDSLADAAGFFRTAIELDPAFAQAHVGLAQSLLLHALYAEQGLERTSESVEAIVARALELDDRLGEAHATLGLSRVLAGDYTGGERAYRRALELNPNSATTHQWYAALLDLRWRPEESLAHLEKALALEPLSPVINLNMADTLEAEGRFDEALTRLRTILEMDAEFVAAYDSIATLHWQALGRLDVAVSWYERLMQRDRGQPAFHAWYAWLLLDLGEVHRSEQWLSRSSQLSPDNLPAGFVAVMLHQFRGENAAAAQNARGMLGRDNVTLPGMRAIVAPYASNFESDAGRYAEAGALLEKAFPQLAGVKPTVDQGNYRAAIDLARVLIRTHDDDKAALLLERSLEVLDRLPRLGDRGYWISDVRIYALQGKTEQALSALRTAIDAGWRVLWWYYLQHDPCLDAIRDEPEFQAMLEEVRGNIAAQRARVSATLSGEDSAEARAGIG